MQWLKKLFSRRRASDGVFVGGEKWNPAPFGSRLRGQDAKHLTEQMTAEQLACIVDSMGDPAKADAVIAICREGSTRLRAEGHTVKD